MWPNVAPFGQPGIGGWVELQNMGVTVQKLPFLTYYSLLIGLVWGPRYRLVLELQRQRNGTEVQTGPFGGAPKRSAKIWFQTWPSNANRMADPWRPDSPEMLCDRSRPFVGP